MFNSVVFRGKSLTNSVNAHAILTIKFKTTELIQTLICLNAFNNVHSILQLIMKEFASATPTFLLKLIPVLDLNAFAIVKLDLSWIKLPAIVIQLFISQKQIRIQQLNQFVFKIAHLILQYLINYAFAITTMQLLLLITILNVFAMSLQALFRAHLTIKNVNVK